MRLMTIVPVIAMVLATLPATVRAELTVTTDFEGGSAVVDAIDATMREIIVRPGGDPTRGWPCWWYLRIDGLPGGQAATLVVRGSQRHARDNGQDTGKPLAANWALPDQAAVSDDGVTWRHTEPGVRQGLNRGCPVPQTKETLITRKMIAELPMNGLSFRIRRSFPPMEKGD